MKETQQDALLLVKGHLDKCTAEGSDWKVLPVKQRIEASDRITTIFEHQFETECMNTVRATAAAVHAQQMELLQKIVKLTQLHSAVVTQDKFNVYDTQIQMACAVFNSLNIAPAGARATLLAQLQYTLANRFLLQRQAGGALVLQ